MSNFFQRRPKLHESIGRVQFVVFEKKSCDYLLIIYMKKFKMVKQKKQRTRITQ